MIKTPFEWLLFIGSTGLNSRFNRKDRKPSLRIDLRSFPWRFLILMRSYSENFCRCTEKIAVNRLISAYYISASKRTQPYSSIFSIIKPCFRLSPPSFNFTFVIQKSSSETIKNQKPRFCKSCKASVFITCGFVFLKMYKAKKRFRIRRKEPGDETMFRLISRCGHTTRRTMFFDYNIADLTERK